MAVKEAASFGVKCGVADFVTPSPIGTKWGLGGRQVFISKMDIRHPNAIDRHLFECWLHPKEVDAHGCKHRRKHQIFRFLWMEVKL